MNLIRLVNKKVFDELILFNFKYIIIETRFTINHIERTNYRDRGKIKWIAETKPIAFEKMELEKEAQNSQIDEQDLFPRLYFLSSSFVEEFTRWVLVRELVVISVEHGEGYEPDHFLGL